MMRAGMLAALMLLAGCAQHVLQTQVGQPAEAPAVEVAQPIKRDPAVRAKAHSDLGFAYFGRAQMKVALEEAQLALDADPNHAPAYRLRGLVYAYLQDSVAARENFERAVRLDPRDSALANDYGWFLCTQGQEREGIERLLQATRDPLYATPTRPYTNAGLCARRMKDNAAAEGYFRNALIMDPANAQALLHLGDIAWAAGDAARAKRYVDEFNRVHEPSAESLWLAVRIERKLGNRQAEQRHATQLRRKFSGTKEHQALTQGRYD